MVLKRRSIDSIIRSIVRVCVFIDYPLRQTLIAMGKKRYSDDKFEKSVIEISGLIDSYWKSSYEGSTMVI